MATDTKQEAQPNGKPGLKLYKMTMTPEIAQEWVRQSKITNRPMNKANRLALKEAMRAGWTLNGAPIILDTRYNILDGHHRLMACIETGINFETVVVEGIPTDAIMTIDDGAKRSLADDLFIESEDMREIGRTLEGTLNLLIRYVAVGSQQRAYYHKIQPRRRILQMERDRLVEAVLETKKNATRNPILTEAIVAALYYLGRLVDAPATNSFLFRVVSGQGLNSGDPALALREVIIKEKSKITRQRRFSFGPDTILRMGIYTLACAISNKEIDRLRLPATVVLSGAEPKVIRKRFGMVSSGLISEAEELEADAQEEKGSSLQKEASA